MDLSTFTCPSCKEYQASDLDSIRIHCQKKHQLSSIELYSQLFLDGKDVKCACGCGQTPKFWSLQRGFAKFVRGHSARVNNNWGHNESAREKSLKKRREEGLWSKDPWNRGKTKENDAEFARISEIAYNSLKEKTRKSKKMKEQWATNNLVPLTGSAHSQWRGGTSELSAMCRSRLYREWSFPKMKAAGFKCTACGATSDLEVHHDKERFSRRALRPSASLGMTSTVSLVLSIGCCGTTQRPTSVAGCCALTATMLSTTPSRNNPANLRDGNCLGLLHQTPYVNLRPEIH